MDAYPKSDSRPPKRSGFYLAFFILGWLVFIVMALFSGRIVYEQTIMTWRHGVQMVGFSLAHAHGELLIVGIGVMLLAHVAIFALVIIAISAKLRRQAIMPGVPSLLLALTLVTGAIYVPYEAWIASMVKVAGPGKNGNSFLMFAITHEDPQLVKLLLDRGVPIDDSERKDTELNVACRIKSLQIARDLIARGAKIERAPDCDRFTELTGKPQLLKVPGETIEVTPN